MLRGLACTGVCNMTYEKWLAELNSLLMREYGSDVFLNADIVDVSALFDEGYTPAEAVAEYEIALENMRDLLI